MRDRIPRQIRRLGTSFGSFTTGQKAITLVGVAVLLGGAFLFATWASKPTLAPLFSNLSSTDASAIVDQLNSGGTPYELTDGGKTIMVPKDKVYDLRLQMSGEGLPAEADSGYSLLDKQGITTSEFMQQVGYQRALEGELANTIQSIDRIRAATVHLVIPQKDVFSDDAKQPTASVLITTQSGSQLDQGQVRAIVHLVASSVEGLDPKNVTVADSKGAVLSTGNGQAMSAEGDVRAQQTEQFQQRMNSALSQMLGSVVGTGHAAVTTTADLDFDQTETKSQTYVSDPDLPALSESIKTESFNGTGGATGGVLGPDNIQVPNGANGAGQYQSSTETRNNAVGLVNETRKSAPGNVRRLSVSVLLDSRTAATIDNAAIEKMVSSAVGLDTTRGDTVSVVSLPFDNSAARAAEEAAQIEAAAAAAAQQAGLIKSGAIGLGVLLLLLVGWRLSRRARRSRLTDEELKKIEDMQAALEEARARALEVAEQKVAKEVANVNSVTASVAITQAEEARRARQKELAVLMERKPGEVAQLLRGWISDRPANTRIVEEARR